MSFSLGNLGASTLPGFGGAFGESGAISGYAGGIQRASRSLLNDYDQYYRSLVQGLPGQAAIPLSTYVNEAAGDVNTGWDRGRGIMQRNLSRMGIDPSSGRYAQALQDYQRAEAAAQAGAMTSARNRGRQENFARGLQAGTLGLNMNNQALSGLAAAGGLMYNAGTLGMASQNQQYSRFNDMMEWLQGGAQGAPGATTAQMATGQGGGGGTFAGSPLGRAFGAIGGGALQLGGF